MSDDKNSDKPVVDENLRPHVYDGIQEYDNRMPNWWLWTFYITIIFSLSTGSLFLTPVSWPPTRSAWRHLKMKWKRNASQLPGM